MPELLFALRALLTLILYTFLGITFYILWLDLKKGEPQPSGEPLQATLFIESEEASQGQCIMLQPITALGRATDNTLMLSDPFASAHHALILWREGQWWIEDLDSHNGTLLNKKPLNTPAALSSGDEIQIGETTLRFEMGTQS